MTSTFQSPGESPERRGIAVLRLPPHARRLDTTPLSDHVYQVLRDAILEGAFDTHEHLVQNQIANQLEVSRTPVRDALLRLSQEGLIRAVGAQGYIVNELTPRDIVDIYEVRMTLEVQAALLAFDHLTPGHIADMQRLNERIAHPERDSAAHYDLNRQFHAVITAACPNKLITRILTEIWDLPVSRRIFRHYMETGVDVESMVNEHQEIIDAVRAGDRRRLADLLTEHLSEARDQASLWLGGNETR